MLTEEFSNEDKEKLIRIREEYLEHIKKFGKSDFLLRRISEIDAALKPLEKSFTYHCSL